MNGAFQIGAIGLEAQQRALDTIASNISNVNTPGFRRSDVRFSELMVNQADPGAVRADLGGSLATSAGVRSEPYLLLNEQGRLETTGRTMDLAIEGRGFIELMGPDGQTLLWRGGTLAIGEDGQLGTAAGGVPLKAAITVPADAAAVEIGADGIVRARMGSDERVEIGQIRLVRVDDPSQVERLDGGFYRVADSASLADAQPGEDGLGRLVQGAIERSTVELTTEMVQMMLVQRAYAANAQIVQAADQLMALANGLRR
ncbi:flagellar hook-basal body protein [Sphingosinicella sp.]|uniref:flagellar hook-basal body protein n=1 Tax=Sphingosinicella sp. TaxID=1917971 RepID=UPI004037D7F6